MFPPYRHLEWSEAESRDLERASAIESLRFLRYGLLCNPPVEMTAGGKPVEMTVWVDAPYCHLERRQHRGRSREIWGGE